MEKARRRSHRSSLKDILAQSKEMFQVLFNHSKDAITLHVLKRNGTVGKFLDANEAACKLLGFSRAELLTMAPGKVVRGMAQEAERDGALRKKLLREGEIRLERELAARDGRFIPVDISAHLFRVRGKSYLLTILRDISTRRHSEKVRASIYRLSEAAATSRNMEELFRSIHEIIRELMPAQNFYIALLDPASGVLSFPYFVDEYDAPLPPRKCGRGLTEYVLRTGKPLLAPPEVERQLKAAGEVEPAGVPVADWLGVPLKTAERTIGVLVIQSYTEGVHFHEEEQSILMFVSSQIASAIERKRAEEALKDSEERYRAFVQQSSEGIWRTTLEVPLSTELPVAEQLAHFYRYSRVAECNDAAAQMYGYKTSAEMIGIPIRDFHIVGAPKNSEFMQTFVKAGYRLVDAESREHDRNGNEKIFLNNTIGIFDGGLLTGVWGTQRDITNERNAQAALRASEERYRLLFERNLAGVFRSTVSGKILDCNDSFARMLGFESREDLLQEIAWNLYYHPGDREYYLFRIREQKAVTNFEQCLRRKDGSPVWVLENVSLLPDQFEGSQVMEGTVVDITDRKKAEDQIAFQAYHDALTGLPNRNLFRDRLVQAVAQATRNRDGLAVLFLDLDHFKLINDTLGHSLGDWLLTRVAERLRKIVREVDTVARLGGDEFIVLLPGIRSGEDAARVAQKVLSGIDDPFRHETQELFVTTSIGISLFPADGDDAETLIRSADNAMYRAKELGRNNYHLFSPALNLRAQTRLSWERDLRRAVDRQEFVMYYQPQIQLRDGRITSMEALIRWQHPDKGLILPGSFIHVAEETRLIFPIGQWAVRTACRQLNEWQRGGFPHLQVSINLSARQFQHEGLMDFIQITLAETGLSPSSLVVEITESIAMQNVELTLSVLKDLREYGIRIALDDFGIGYSSLSYLKHFPVDIIKIDTSFIRDVGRGQQEDALVRAVIQLGANMNRQVIAEGIETSEQRNFLLLEGCDLAQGFLFSPAVPPGEALVLLKDGKL